MNGIENITKRIAEEAEVSAREIIAAAEAEVRAMREEYAKKSEHIRDKILGRGKTVAEEKGQRMESAAALEARKAILAKKQELIGRAFDEAARELSSLSGEEKAEVLSRLALRAANGGAGEIILSEKEKAEIGELVIKKCAQNRGIILSEETREISDGLIFRDGKSEVNCTFAFLASQLREPMSREIADILFG